MQLLESMLKFGVNPNARDDKSMTELMVIAEKNQYRQRHQKIAAEVTRLLLENGADPDLTDVTNTTALYRAARTGNIEVAEILIKSGADTNIASNNEQTPLLVAITKKHNTIVQALLAAGADPNRQAVWGMNKAYPLEVAARHNNPEMLKLLFENGAILDPASRDLCDLVNYGAKHPKVIRMIVKTGVDLNQRDPLKRYPLDIVVRHGNSESIQYLLENGVDPVLPDWKGMQPFMHFVRNGHAELVETSIETNPKLRNNEKLMRDGMYWAVRAAHPEVVKVMLKYNVGFQRIEAVEALLKWAKVPPASEADKQEIMQLFTEYFLNNKGPESIQSYKPTNIFILTPPD